MLCPAPLQANSLDFSFDIMTVRCIYYAGIIDNIGNKVGDIGQKCNEKGLTENFRKSFC